MCLGEDLHPFSWCYSLDLELIKHFDKRRGAKSAYSWGGGEGIC